MAKPTREDCMKMMHDAYDAVMDEVDSQMSSGFTSVFKNDVKNAINNNYGEVVDKVCSQYPSGSGKRLRPEMPIADPTDVITSAWEKGNAVLDRPHPPYSIEDTQELKQIFQQAREDLIQTIVSREQSQELLEKYKLELR